MSAVTTKLPEWVKKPVRRLQDVLRKVPYYGKGRFCPVCCKSSRHFRHFGRMQRKDAKCVHCGSLERHRFLWLFLQKKTDLFNGKPKKMLHVAPERCLADRFKDRIDGDYVTADLFNPRAMVKMDITDIQYADQTFDVIYCSHVFEHVPDDKQAMREFFRVLKNNGWAILIVPITCDKTFEDSSIVDPKERLKAFGQEDHVRRYGPDYVDRLRDAGFTVETTRISDLVDRSDAVRMGLTSAGNIYYCTK